MVEDDKKNNKNPKIDNNEDYTIELLGEEENILNNEGDKNIITIIDEKEKATKPNYPLYYNNIKNTHMSLSKYIYNI